MSSRILQNIFKKTDSLLHRRFSSDVVQWLNSFTGGEISMKIVQNFAVVEINNPNKKNSLTGSMMVQFSNIVIELEKWNEGQGVVLIGANGDFCSGGDLTFVEQIANPEMGNRVSSFMQSVVVRFARLPLISVAVIEGFALGGGAELTMSCDYRLMTRDAKLGFVQANLGITTGWGGGYLMQRRFGYSKTLHALTNATVFNADDAQNYGFADDVVEKASIETYISWLKNRLAGNANITRQLKMLYMNDLLDKYDGLLDGERNVLSKFWGSEDHKLALCKVLKRK